VTAFADSSALVKLYVGETGHEQVDGLPALVIAQVSRVEVPSAFWRKHRLGELSAEDARILTVEFEADFFGDREHRPRFAAIGTTVAMLDEAARACATHGLRAYDAVQLSSAQVARRQDPACDTVAAFDRTLRRAAAAEGFALIPPVLEPSPATPDPPAPNPATGD